MKQHIQTFESFINESKTITADDIRGMSKASDVEPFVKRMDLEELKAFLNIVKDLYKSTGEKKFQEMYYETRRPENNGTFMAAVAKSLLKPGTVLRPDVKAGSEAAPDRWMRFLSGKWDNPEYNKDNGKIFAEEFIVKKVARTNATVEVPMGYFVSDKTKIANITRPVEVRDVTGQVDLYLLVYSVFAYTPEGEVLFSKFPEDIA